MVKKKFRVVIFALILAIIVAIASIAIIFFERKKVQESQDMVTQLQTELNDNQQEVYVALRDIDAGERLIDNADEGTVNVAMTDIYSGIDTGIYMTSDQIGQKALIDIKAGAAVQKTMIAEQDITNDTRTYEIGEVNLTTRQSNHDVVDIRIVFPDGTDYILLSKKTIQNLSGQYFDVLMNEDEILRYESALVDAVENGARLYTTKYVHETLQDDATAFYPVKQTTLDEIASDPNIVQVAQSTLNASVRQNLEDRMYNLKQANTDENGNVTSQLSADFRGQISVTAPTVQESVDGATTDSYSEDTSAETVE